MKRPTLPNATANATPAGTRRAAFTLIEIMVVLAVIAVIAVMAVPAMNSVLKGSKMTQAADGFQRDLVRAQAAALRENAPIEFRFYKYSDPEQPNSPVAYRAYQAVKRVREAEDVYSTAEIVPIFETRLLPPRIIFSEDVKRSTILKIKDIKDNTAENHATYDDSIPRVKSAEYKAFYFRPDGSTNLVSIDGSENWCVTILPEEAAGGEALPPDFVTFQVDAYNGQARRFEKGL